MNNNKEQRQRINIDINTLKLVPCLSCGCLIFKTGFTMIKKLSALQSPSGKEQLVSINPIRCSNCKRFFRVENNELKRINHSDLFSEAQEEDHSVIEELKKELKKEMNK